jgi:enoyl-CoA hydratase
MTEPSLLKSDADGISQVVFNRPDKLNAINSEIMTGLWAAVRELRDRPDLRVLLIRAKGRYFSAGADLLQGDGSGSGDFGGSVMEARRRMRVDMGTQMQALWQEMEKVEKPIVVAHHATCTGAGLEMSLSCDFRLAARSASYWFPEMQQGMLPLSGGVSRLARLCGAHWTKWMVMANRQVPAERALIMGLVHEIYPDETFEDDVMEFCKVLAGYPPEAMAIGKLAVDLASDLESDQARQLERLAYSALALGEEHRTMSAALRNRLKTGKSKA